MPFALFRARGADRHQKRSAVVALANVLEERHSLLKAELPSKDEDARRPPVAEIVMGSRRSLRRAVRASGDGLAGAAHPAATLRAA
jgi:hypothetical protein